MKTSKFDWINFWLWAVGVFFIFLFLSIRVPFFLNSKTEIFFEIFAPIIIFSVMLYLFLKKDSRGRPLARAYRGDSPSLGKGVKAVCFVVIFLAIFSFGAGFFLQYMLAYPTKFFAMVSFSVNGAVIDSYKYSFSFRGSNKVESTLFQNNQHITFLWPSNLSRQFRNGDCINLKGRSWVFGSYIEHVDVISCN
jgi:hypothetical protein